MFLLADAVLASMDNVTSGLVVYPKRIHAHNMEELPFMATENMIMKMVAKGGSRQKAHHHIRDMSQVASHQVKHEGGKNNLVELVKKDTYFEPIWADIDDMLDPKLFIGRSPAIVERFCGAGGVLEGKLAKYEEFLKGAKNTELSV